jgi:hypothetical protein
VNQIHLRVTQNKRTIEMTFTDTGDGTGRVVNYVNAVLRALDETERAEAYKSPQVTAGVVRQRDCGCGKTSPGLEPSHAKS